MVDAVDRTVALFEPEHVTESPTPEVMLEGPTLRVVYWIDEDESFVEEDIVVTLKRPCLVRCENGERNVRSIRKLKTLCGNECDDCARTTAIPPADLQYCQTCHALAGNGVLR
jgi:hypothetical protein